MHLNGFLSRRVFRAIKMKPSKLLGALRSQADSDDLPGADRPALHLVR